MSFILNEETGNVEYTEAVTDNGSLFPDPVVDQPVPGSAGEGSADIEDTVSSEPVEEDVVLESSDKEVSAGSSVELLDGDSEVVGVTSEEVGDTIIQYVVYADTASSLGFPSSNSLDYLSDIVMGYPASYKYAAYRTSNEYSQSMVLFVGRDASSSGSTITFDDVDIIELVYSRDNNYTSQIHRYFSEQDSAVVNLDSQSIAYTNVIPGYGVFDTEVTAKVNSGFLTAGLIAAAAALLFKSLFGGVRHV